jgi:hypothetical protein
MWVTKFKKHNQLKNRILSAIDEMPKYSYQTNKKTYATKSDWNIPKNFKRNYLDLFYKEISEHMFKTANSFNCKMWIIHNSWFMQYYKNDLHDWHTHPKTNLSAVYYLELPKKELVTEFKNKTKVKAKEGDILFFPAYLLHRAPRNKSKERKTVISFNCDFYNL